MKSFRPVLIAAALAACSHPATKVAPPPPPPDAAPAATAPPPHDPEQDVARAAQVITADVLRAPIATLASDEFAGRGPTTPGDTKTRAFLIDQMKQLGLQPAGPDGGWEQPFEVVGVTATMPKTWTFKRGGKALAMKWHDQYIAASGVQTATGKIDKAEVVFVGYGITAPEYGWDDWKGVDVKGKVVLMLNNDPDWDPALFAGTTRLYYGRWDYKYEAAARHGAAGAIIIHTTPSAGYPFQVVQTSWTGEQFELASSGDPAAQLEGWLTEDAARQLVKFAGKDLDALIKAAHTKEFAPVPLGVTTSIAFTNKVTHGQTANVMGLLPGSDPAVASEVVVYTAHHDHLGVGEADAQGDTIYNGALDNAAGCAEVLAIARAMKALPAAPRRSVLFLFVAGEEQGLLGSQFYASHPTVPPGRIAADINFDGGNIWGKTKDVTYIGLGKSDLDKIVVAEAQRQGRVVKPDQFPDRGHFYRSDQFSFARVGVPSIYLDAGTDFVGREPDWGKHQMEAFEEHHYHQPSDQLRDDWNFDGMIQDVQLGFRAGLVVANQAALPAWAPGDEFEAARKASLGAK